MPAAGLLLSLFATVAVVGSMELGTHLEGIVMRTQGTKEVQQYLKRKAVPVRKAPQTIHERREVRRMSRLMVRGTDIQEVSLRAAAPAEDVIGGIAVDSFPPLLYTVNPFDMVPNWGNMYSPAEWQQTYDELSADEMVPVPAYDMSILLQPLKTLKNRTSQSEIDAITSKLYYSTRYYGSYDIDAAEYTADHPGVDLKVAEGTPVHVIGGGRVQTVGQSKSLGLHVIVEHHLPTGQRVFSVYGHLGSTDVLEGQDLLPGTIIGKVGLTGNTSAPHLHLQIDIGTATEGIHTPYWPESTHIDPVEANRHTLHPIHFIEEYKSR